MRYFKEGKSIPKRNGRQPSSFEQGSTWNKDQLDPLLFLSAICLEGQGVFTTMGKNFWLHSNPIPCMFHKLRVTLFISWVIWNSKTKCLKYCAEPPYVRAQFFLHSDQCQVKTYKSSFRVTVGARGCIKGATSRYFESFSATCKNYLER